MTDMTGITTTSTARYLPASAFRAAYNAVQGELEGYLAVWGSPNRRDSYGTWFDAKRPPNLGLGPNNKFLPIRLMYEHGHDGDVQKEIIGEIYQIWQDSNGIRFKARLDRQAPCFGKVVQELQARKLGFSSASTVHLADFDGEGRFVNWYLSEGSLTKTPSENRMPAVSLVRSEGRFDPNQPRDPSGQWSETGAGGGSASGEKTAESPATPVSSETSVTGPKKTMVKPKVKKLSENAKVSGKTNETDFLKKHNTTREDLLSNTGINELGDADLDNARVSIKYNSSSAVVAIKTKDGKIDMERAFVYKNGKPDHIKNNHFYMDKSATGTGIGTKILNSQVESASAAGFKQIRTIGGKSEYMNGYYTWPRLGYDGTARIIRGQVPKSLESLDISPADGSKSPFSMGMYRLSDLMQTEEGRNLWKQRGHQVDLTFDLKPGSRSRKILDAYYKERFRSNRSVRAGIPPASGAPDPNELPDDGEIFSDEEETLLDEIWDAIKFDVPPSELPDEQDFDDTGDIDSAPTAQPTAQNGAAENTIERRSASGASRSGAINAYRQNVTTNTSTNTRNDDMEPLTLEKLGIAPGTPIQDVLSALSDLMSQLQAGLSGEQPAALADEKPMDEMPDTKQEEKLPMPMDERSKKQAQPTQNTELAAMRAELEALRKQMVKDMTAPTPEAPAARSRQVSQVSVSEPLKYSHLKLNDLTFSYMALRGKGIRPSDEFMRILGGRAALAIEKGEPNMTSPVIRSVLPATRANEIAISTAAGGGDEWVAIEWSSKIWETARNNRIYQLLVNKGMRIEEVPQGRESIYIPTEGADPTVYTIAQNADLSSGRPQVNVSATRIGTGRVSLAPGELGMAVVYSDVFEEDSLVPVASQYNRQMAEKAEETIEQLMLNGDTDTNANTNINLIDGTPGTGLSTPYYIASNGLLKYALVTGSGTSRDGGALDEDDYRLTLKLMPSAIRTRLQNLAFVIDPDTHSTSLNIAAIKTDDVRRTTATITSGVLTNIWGVDVFTSGFMPLANSAGKIPAAGGTLGRILCVYAPYWAMGWKRRIRVEADRDILSGDNIIVAKMRLGFVARGAGASTASYNLTIA